MADYEHGFGEHCWAIVTFREVPWNPSLWSQIWWAAKAAPGRMEPCDTSILAGGWLGKNRGFGYFLHRECLDSRPPDEYAILEGSGTSVWTMREEVGMGVSLMAFSLALCSACSLLPNCRCNVTNFFTLFLPSLPCRDGLALSSNKLVLPWLALSGYFGLSNKESDGHVESPCSTLATLRLSDTWCWYISYRKWNL